MNYSPPLSHIPTKYKYDIDNEIGKLPLRNILEKNNAASLITTRKIRV